MDTIPRRPRNRGRALSFHCLRAYVPPDSAIQRPFSASSTLIDSLDLPIAWGILTTFIHDKISILEQRLDSLCHRLDTSSTTTITSSSLTSSITSSTATALPSDINYSRHVSSSCTSSSSFSSSSASYPAKFRVPSSTSIDRFIIQVRDYLESIRQGLPLPELPEIPFVLSTTDFADYTSTIGIPSPTYAAAPTTTSSSSSSPSASPSSPALTPTPMTKSRSTSSTSTNHTCNSDNNDDLYESLHVNLSHLHNLALYFYEYSPPSFSLKSLSELYDTVPSPSEFFVSAAGSSHYYNEYYSKVAGVSEIRDYVRDYVAEESERIGAKMQAEKAKIKTFFEQESERFKTFLLRQEAKVKEIIVDEADHFRQALANGAKRLLLYDELPSEWKYNEYIRSGYRFIPIDRWHDLVWSLCGWHNETGNIYTHIFGAITIIYMLFSVFPASQPALSPSVYDSAVVLSFILCALKCLVFSSLWHLFSGCATIHVFNRSACLDYVGISSLIAASILTTVHYGFYCRPDLSRIYGTVIGTLGVIGLIMPWVEWFNKKRGYRVLFFVSMSASALAPMYHMSVLYGLKETIFFFSPISISVLSYIFGLALYCLNVPERLRPGGLFDTLFHSHQFWHVAVVLAIWFHWWAVLRFHQHGTSGFSCQLKETLQDQSSIFENMSFLSFMHQEQQQIQNWQNMGISF